MKRSDVLAGVDLGLFTMFASTAGAARLRRIRAANSTARCCRFPAAVKPITELDARDAKAPPRFEVKAPRARPMSSSC